MRRRRTNRGVFVAIIGPDGVGKTKLASELTRRSSKGSGYFHFLPDLGTRLITAPQDLSVPTPKNWSDGSRVLGILRIGRNLIRAWIGYVVSILPALRNGKTVVGDRWLYGYLAQPRPLKFFGPDWIARLVIRLAPRPDLVILLEAPPSVIHQRKSELSLDQIANETIQWCAAAPTALRLEATRSTEELADIALAHISPSIRLKTYPPILGQVLLPATPRAAALSGSSLYTPSRNRGLLGHRVGRLLLSSLGTAWLGHAGQETLPISPEGWTEIVKLLRSSGIDIEAIAVSKRIQGERVGFSLLAIGEDGPSAFVRVSSVTPLEAECRAVTLVEASQPNSFRAPRLLMRGEYDNIGFAAFSVVLNGFHVPARLPPLNDITAEVQAALGVIPKPTGTPTHWVPMHGDLTPWNLRAEKAELKLIDWEAVGWGPPHADDVLFWATSRALGLPSPNFEPDGEAAKFWLDRFASPSSRRDERLSISLHSVLRR